MAQIFQLCERVARGGFVRVFLPGMGIIMRRSVRRAMRRFAMAGLVSLAAIFTSQIAFTSSAWATITFNKAGGTGSLGTFMGVTDRGGTYNFVIPTICGDKSWCYLPPLIDNTVRPPAPLLTRGQSTLSYSPDGTSLPTGRWCTVVNCTDAMIAANTCKCYTAGGSYYYTSTAYSELNADNLVLYATWSCNEGYYLGESLNSTSCTDPQPSYYSGNGVGYQYKCPDAAPNAWIRPDVNPIDSTHCHAIENPPTGCTTGKVLKRVGSISAIPTNTSPASPWSKTYTSQPTITWGVMNVQEPLSASPNHYVDDYSCPTCASYNPARPYSPGGTGGPSICTATPPSNVTLTLNKMGGSGQLYNGANIGGNNSSNATLTCSGTGCKLPPTNTLTRANSTMNYNPDGTHYYLHGTWCDAPNAAAFPGHQCWETDGTPTFTSNQTLYATWSCDMGYYLGTTAGSTSCVLAGQGYYSRYSEGYRYQCPPEAPDTESATNSAIHQCFLKTKPEGCASGEVRSYVDHGPAGTTLENYWTYTYNDDVGYKIFLAEPIVAIALSALPNHYVDGADCPPCPSLTPYSPGGTGGPSICTATSSNVTVTLDKMGGSGTLSISGFSGSTITDPGGTANATVNCGANGCTLPVITGALTRANSMSDCTRDSGKWCDAPNCTPEREKASLCTCWSHNVGGVWNSSQSVPFNPTSNMTLYAYWDCNEGYYLGTSTTSRSCTTVAAGYYSYRCDAYRRKCPHTSTSTTTTSGTTSNEYHDCYKQETPANCASGSVKSFVNSLDVEHDTLTNNWTYTFSSPVPENNITWETPSIITALTANAGYYVNNPTFSCPACPAGTTSPQGNTGGSSICTPIVVDTVITLNKNGGTGTIPGTGVSTNSGTASATLTCTGTSCLLPAVARPQGSGGTVHISYLNRANSSSVHTPEGVLISYGRWCTTRNCTAAQQTAGTCTCYTIDDNNGTNHTIGVNTTLYANWSCDGGYHLGTSADSQQCTTVGSQYFSPIGYAYKYKCPSWAPNTLSTDSPSITACYASGRPENCTAGEVRKYAASDVSFPTVSSGTWAYDYSTQPPESWWYGEVITPLQAAAGYFVNSLFRTCDPCPEGTTSPQGNTGGPEVCYASSQLILKKAGGTGQLYYADGTPVGGNNSSDVAITCNGTSCNLPVYIDFTGTIIGADLLAPLLTRSNSVLGYSYHPDYDAGSRWCTSTDCSFLDEQAGTCTCYRGMDSPQTISSNTTLYARWSCLAGYYMGTATPSTSCVAVGNNYYSENMNGYRYACPTGYTTSGSGPLAGSNYHCTKTPENCTAGSCSVPHNTAMPTVLSNRTYTYSSQPTFTPTCSGMVAPVNYYVNTAEGKCSPCPNGYISPGGTVTSCTPANHTLTLNKVGGTGTLTGTGVSANSGTASATLTCSGNSCTLPQLHYGGTWAALGRTASTLASAPDGNTNGRGQWCTTMRCTRAQMSAGTCTCYTVNSDVGSVHTIPSNITVLYAQWSCDGGYYLKTDTTCEAVGSGYYSNDGRGFRLQCPSAAPNTANNYGVNISACYKTELPTGCASGSVKTVVSSATEPTNLSSNFTYTYATQPTDIVWGSTSVLTPLGANTNNYVTGTSCPACSTVGNGTWNLSDGGAITNAYCYKNCTVTPPAATVSGRDYYTATDTCTITSCITHYNLSGGVCNPNVYTVSFNANGGSGTTQAVNCTYGQSCLLRPNGFTYGSNTFIGWATSSSGAAVYGNACPISPTSNMTLYANWYAWAPNLHVGSNSIQLSPTRQSTPALNVLRDGTRYYGTLTPTTVSGAPKIKVGTTNYSLIPDTNSLPLTCD